MSRVKSVAVMVVSGAAIASSCYFHGERYSNSQIWKRQTGLIETTTSGKPKLNESKYRELRQKLTKLGDSNDERCKFEQDFRIELLKGSKEAAELYKLKKSFDPYEECQTMPQLKETATRWYGWLGIAGAVLLFGSGISLLESFRKGRS